MNVKDLSGLYGIRERTVQKNLEEIRDYGVYNFAPIEAGVAKISENDVLVYDVFRALIKGGFKDREKRLKLIQLYALELNYGHYDDMINHSKSCHKRDDDI